MCPGSPNPVFRLRRIHPTTQRSKQAFDPLCPARVGAGSNPPLRTGLAYCGFFFSGVAGLGCAMVLGFQ